MEGLVPPGILDRIATEALRRAARPLDGNPLVLAYELGFEMLPMPPGSCPEFRETTHDRIVFACEAGIEEHARRVRLALARGLLLRNGVAHNEVDMGALADRLGQAKNT